MKKTPWFPGDAKPVRDGVYEREWVAVLHPIPSLWNGRCWSIDTRDGTLVSRWQALPWRGLAQDPKVVTK